MPGKRLEVFDQQVLGLLLRVTDQGKKSWAVRYRAIDGRQRRHALGQYPGISLASARAEALAVLTRARKGEDPSADRVRERAEAKSEPIKTLADLAGTYFRACEIGEWRPRKKNKRPTTLAEERGLWARHVETPLGNLRVEEITAAAIRKVLRELVAKGHGVTSNRVRALIRQLMNFAISEQRITTNPVAMVPALAQETPRHRVMTDDELKSVWSALSDPSGLRKPSPDPAIEGKRVYIGSSVAIAIKLLLLTMARRSEVASATISEFDLKHGVWIIPGERTKNGRRQSVPLVPAAIELLEEALGIAGGNVASRKFLFPSPRSSQVDGTEVSINPAALTHAFRDLRLALGIEDLHPHDLRRTCASIMASERLKIPPYVIGRLLNHTSETGGAASVTVTTYAVYDYASEKRDALVAWQSLLLDIVKSDTDNTETANGTAT
jgi:integrase